MKPAKCPICDYTDISQESSCCPRCGADFSESAPEKKQMSGPGTFTTEDKQFFGKMGTNATFYLTDRRLIAIPAKLEGFNLTTALTAAVINKMTSKYGVVSIPREQIKAVRDGKFGLLGKAIIIDTTDGELLKITVTKQKAWKEALSNMVPSPR